MDVTAIEGGPGFSNFDSALEQYDAWVPGTGKNRRVARSIGLFTPDLTVRSNVFPVPIFFVVHIFSSFLWYTTRSRNLVPPLPRSTDHQA